MFKERVEAGGTEGVEEGGQWRGEEGGPLFDCDPPVSLLCRPCFVQLAVGLHNARYIVRTEICVQINTEHVHVLLNPVVQLNL